MILSCGSLRASSLPGRQAGNLTARITDNYLTSTKFRLGFFVDGDMDVVEGADAHDLADLT